MVVFDMDSPPSGSMDENEVIRSPGIRSLLAIPMYSPGKSLTGCITFENVRNPREWLDEEIRSLRIIAEMVSVHQDREEVLAALREEEQKFMALYEESENRERIYYSLIDTSSDAIVISDMEDRVQYLSPSFVDIFGWRLEDVQGKNIPYIPDNEKAAYRAVRKDIIENGTTYKGLVLPPRGVILLSIADRDKPEALPLIRKFSTAGYKIYATEGTAAMLETAGLPVKMISKKLTEGHPNIIDIINDGTVSGVVNTITGGSVPLRDGFYIRRAAAEKQVPCFTSLDTARVAIEAIMNGSQVYSIEPLTDYRDKKPI